MTVCQVPGQSQARISPILAGVLGMLALILVMLRLVQRFLRNRAFGFDDGLVVAALICAAPLNCLIFPSKLGLYLKLQQLPSTLILTKCSAGIWTGNQYLDHPL